jgi:hypothetical protein
VRFRNDVRGEESSGLYLNSSGIDINERSNRPRARAGNVSGESMRNVSRNWRTRLRKKNGLDQSNVSISARFDGVVGYRICLTHRRSSVRSWVEPFLFLHTCTCKCKSLF